MKRLTLIFLVCLVSAVFIYGVALAGVNEWTSIGPYGVAIRCLTIDPSTPPILYAGGDGVFKSTDEGKTWIQIGEFQTYSLAVDPLTPTTIYAGSHTELQEGFVGRYYAKPRVYRSSDGGANWVASDSGFSGPGDDIIYATDLSIDPSTPTVLYAVTNSTHYPNLVSAYAYKSTDAGISWSPLPIEDTVYGLAIDPITPSILYVGTDKGVCKSTDGGATWLNTSPSAMILIVIDPITPSTLYAQWYDGGVFKSTDGGTNWASLNTAFDTAALAIDPVTPSTLYAGTDNGVYKSTDGGANWSAMNTSLSGLTVQTLAIDPITPSILYAGTDDGVYKYETASDGGSSGGGAVVSSGGGGGGGG